jgi:BA14K-like protein
MIVAHSAGLSGPLCVVAALALCPSSATAQNVETAPSSESMVDDEPNRLIKLAADRSWGGGGGSSRGFSGSGGGGGSVRSHSSSGSSGSVRSFSAPRSGSAPRAGQFGSSAGGSMAKSRMQTQSGRSATSRIVVPGRPPTLSATPGTTAKALHTLPRVRLQATRKPPGSLALVNRGWRDNPGWKKPAGIGHNPGFKAGKSGWMHNHRPFYFKHKGHRWHRHYYTYFVGGLWYWYWYDVVADTDPAAVAYPEPVLPECDPDGDECVEPPLVAPALLEGRVTQAALDRCAAEYVSFDPETGTYVRADGEAQVCPYLR